MHSDAADVGYGGTLGFKVGQGLPGLWEGRGFWNATDRVHSITFRELRAVRLLFHRHFARYLPSPSIQRLLLHEDNQAVVCVLNAMVSASKAMMAEPRKLQVLLRVLGVTIEARWIPSAVNRYADALSRTWDPGDARATTTLLQSNRKEHHLDHVVFRDRPLGDNAVAPAKYLATQMEEFWGDGTARLWNPPFDLLPLVVRKIESEGGRGILVAPHWPAQACFARLQSLGSRLTVLHPGEGAGSLLEGELYQDRWSEVLAEISYTGLGRTVFVTPSSD